MNVTVTNQIIVDEAGNWVSLEDAARMINEHAKLKAALEEVRETLHEARRELHACQLVIHLAGGFDPAYVKGAKLAITKLNYLLGDTI